MPKIFDPAATAISAVENVSRVPVTKADLKRILLSGDGEPAHVRVLFEEVDLTTMMRLAISFEISDAALARAYFHARELHHVHNSDIEEIARELGMTADSARASA
jgi:hypothetical protein